MSVHVSVGTGDSWPLAPRWPNREGKCGQLLMCPGSGGSEAARRGQEKSVRLTCPQTAQGLLSGCCPTPHEPGVSPPTCTSSSWALTGKTEESGPHPGASLSPSRHTAPCVWEIVQLSPLHPCGGGSPIAPMHCSSQEAHLHGLLLFGAYKNFTTTDAPVGAQETQSAPHLSTRAWRTHRPSGGSVGHPQHTSRRKGLQAQTPPGPRFHVASYSTTRPLFKMKCLLLTAGHWLKDAVKFRLVKGSAFGSHSLNL